MNAFYLKQENPQNAFLSVKKTDSCGITSKS